ncbi:hypothetical protein THASP1DRAFT_23774, partial [Thamnocephalis sphaerospora]
MDGGSDQGYADPQSTPRVWLRRNLSSTHMQRSQSAEPSVQHWSNGNGASLVGATETGVAGDGVSIDNTITSDDRPPLSRTMSTRTVLANFGSDIGSRSRATSESYSEKDADFEAVDNVRSPLVSKKHDDLPHAAPLLPDGYFDARPLWSSTRAPHDSEVDDIVEMPNPFAGAISPSVGTPSSDDFSPSTNTAMQDPRRRKHKLLVLWPVPVVTRYVAIVTAIVSLMAALDALPARCTAPSFVIHRANYFQLLVSPFYVPVTFPAVLLGL